MATSNTGLFVWHEHMTLDPKAAIAFYTEVIGWKVQPFSDTSDYMMWVGSQGPLGGVVKLPDAAVKMGAPPHWMGHVQVDNVDATVALATRRGAKLYVAEDIPNVGRFAVLADPQGAQLSVFTPSGPMPLHDTNKEGEFCWNELVTSDVPAALDFYAALFGWKVTREVDMGPMGTYRMLGVGDRSAGGLMAIPTGAPMPPAWVHYAETSDLDATMKRATSKGGKVLMGPEEIPGGGRIAQLTDPQGGVFALHQAARKA